MTASRRPSRALVTGWPSFLHGEATAGDVLAMDAVRRALESSGLPCDLAWSPVLRPGGPALADCPPERYTHLVFACGPARGWQVEELHERYRDCRRIAVGVSVIDPADPAVTGFHAVLPRDVPGAPAQVDLAAAVTVAPVPVAAVILANDQPEYAGQGRHGPVTAELGGWLATVDCARVALDTRLGTGEWRTPSTAAQVESAIARADVVITTRLHGLVLALKNGVPVVAADPVAGGAKVAAQASAWDWPVLVAQAGDPALDRGELGRLWAWCRSPGGIGAARSARARSARARSAGAGPGGPGLTAELLRALDPAAGQAPGQFAAGGRG